MQSSEFLFKKTFELSTKGLFTFIVCAKVFVRPLDESQRHNRQGFFPRQEESTHSINPQL